MVAFMATCALGANAASYVVGQKFTSVDDLAGKQFTIVNESEGMAVYNSENQKLKYDTYATAVTGACYQFVLESLDNNADASVHGMYALKCVKTDGTSPTVYGQTPLYLNSGKPDGFNGCFVLGNGGAQLGTDFQYGGVWEVNYVEGAGFTLKNKGIGGYFKGVGSRPDATDPVYWTFCTLIEDPLIAAQEKYNALKTKYLAINAELDVTEAEALYSSATTVEEAQAAIDKLVSIFGTYLAGVEGETNLTSLITNPSFETGNTTGWTYEGSTDAGAKQNSNGTYTIENADGAYVFNIWSSGNLISQTIENLPNGNYKLVALIATDADHQVKLSANGKSVTVDSYGGEDSKKHGVDGTVEFQVLDNTATIGAEGVNKYWYKVDNFRLFYTGAITDLTPYADALTEAVNEAKKIAQGTIPYTAYQVLQANITTYDKEWTSIDEYNTAIEAVNSATNAATALVNPYATWLQLKATATTLATGHDNLIAAINKVAVSVETLTTAAEIESVNTLTTAMITNYSAWYELKNSADALVAVSNNNSEANATLVGVITAQDNVITTAAVDTQDDIVKLINVTIPTATATLKAAMVEYAGVAEPVGDGAKFDLTFMLTNPDVTKFWDGTWWIQPAGWYRDQTDGNFQVMQNGSVDASDGVHKIFMEYYYLNNGKTYDNGKFNIYTKATLPAGTYTMNCYAFAKEENYSSGNPNPQVYFYANDTQGSLVSSNKLTEQSISFVNESDQEVKIGLKPLTGNTYNWMGIGYVKLYKVPAQSYEVDETAAWDYTQEGAGEVTLKRTIKVGVNTLVLPFSMTQAEVEANFGEGSKVYALKSYDATKELLSFESHDGISANQPCLLKAETAGESYTLADRTIVASASDNPETEVTGAKMIGTYAATMNAPQGSYIISGGKIYNVNSDVALKNTRAYIELTGSTARALTFTLDGGETTGIATMENGQLNVETGVIYDLSGRVVKNPAKGIYVINGKKIVK